MVMYAEPRRGEEAIFDEAIKIKSSAERAAFVKSTCGDDTALLARLEALLKVHFEDESFLKSPPVGVDVTLDASPLTECPGTRIGRYKLLQLIGEGGFGVVYMAEQEEPIVRRVALKIIKLGMDTKQVIARFEAERQALAMMDHPNIARVLDAGATDTGRPYFVMELVKGISITEYCDKNDLDTQKRLELFIDVCKAVQHAHQKGIIHRDIKPSNVMITLHDGTAVPKIIDFGIAKATQQRLTEKTLFTEYRQFIGTPEYMSPEQAEMSGLDIDTRTDIYSLGVLLYELLTGTTPFEADKLRSATYDEIRRIIREDEPPKPSTRLSTLGEALTDIAKRRSVQPGELCRIMRGDLDWVVMKTIEKDRTRRYETANELAMDVERHLKDEPVSAGPPSAAYRLRKFVRRHRAAVISGLLVAAAIIIGLCLAMVGFLQASREQRRTKAALQRAGMNFEMARTAVDEMTQVAQDHLVNIPKAEKVRQDLLESAQTLYLKFLESKSNDPALRQETGGAYYRLGTIQNTLGQYEKAAASFRQAINFFELLATDYPDVPDHRMMIALSNNSFGLALEKLGRYTEVQDAYQAASDLLTVLVNDFPDEAKYREAQAETYNNQGLILNSIGQIDQAQEAFEDALKIREKLATQFPDNPKYRHDLANSYHNRGIALEGKICLAHIDASQYPEVERTYRQAMQLQQLLVNDFPQVHQYQHQLVNIQLSLSNLLWNMVRCQEAEEIVRDGLPLAEKLADDFPGIPEYQITLVEMRHGLSILLGQITYPGATFTDDDPAMDTVLKARQCYEKLVSDSPEVHSYHAGLAKTFAYLSFWNDPEYPSMLGEAIRHQQTAVRLNPMHTMYRWMLVEWCEQLFCNSMGFRRSLEQVEQICKQNIALFEQLRQDIPSCCSDLARSLVILGNLLEYTGRREEAKSAYQRAEEVRLELVARFPNLPFEWRLGNLGTVADYKVRINSAGDYRLYIRPAAYDWASDSVCARIEELADGPGGTIADWYYCDFQDRSDCKFGAWSTSTEFETIPIYLAVDTWPISAPGDYTIRLFRREDGAAIDAFVFQLADLPAPEGDGPPESAITEDGVFLESDGQVTAEAEHFARRVPYRNKWLIIPEEDANASSSLCLFENFRGQGYIQALPDSGNTIKRIEQLTRILKNHPEDVSAIKERGDTYQHLEQYDKAFADYSEAIRLDPNNPGSWGGRGDIHLNMKQWDKAIADYSKAIELKPDDWWYRHERGFAYMQLEQWDKVVTDYTEAIPLNPDNWGSYVRRAQAYQALGQFDKAISDFTKAVKHFEDLAADFPNEPHYRDGLAHPRVQLGQLFARTGRQEEAEQAYRQGIEIWEKLAADFPAVPNYRSFLAHTRSALTNLLMDIGRLEEAEQNIRQAIELFEKLATDFPTVAEYRSPLAHTHNALSILLMDTGRLEEAEQNIRQAIELFEKLATDFNNVPEYRWNTACEYGGFLGGVLSRSGRQEEAEQAYRQGIEICEKLAADFPAVPNYQNSLANDYISLGDVLRKAGRLKEAKHAYQKGLDIRRMLGTDDPPTLNGLAWLLATSPMDELRNGAKATEYATKACELTEWKNSSYVDTLAAAYAEAGDFDSAVKWQKRAIDSLTGKEPAGWRAGFEARLKLYQSGRPYRGH